MVVWVAGGNGQWRERAAPARVRRAPAADRLTLSRRKVGWSLAILLALVFSKAFYTTSLNTYYTFYLIGKFGLSIEEAQIYLFIFLAAVALGTLIGGPPGDRIGRKTVVWGSILGAGPVTPALPHAYRFWPR